MRAWVARAEDRAAIGFAEADIRSYAEGCAGPAPYLEGIWVRETWRRCGVGSALLAAVRQWARARGYVELGSDASIDNAASHRWHRAVGFAEVERLVVFRMPL